MMIAFSSAFLLVPWLWILLHLNDALVVLSLRQERGRLVPIIYQPFSGVSVTSYNEDCLWDCAILNQIMVAFGFSGALTENYCIIPWCTANGIKLQAEYTREGVTLQISFNRLNDGSKLQADFSCTEGFEPLVNGTEVENNQHQWSVSKINSEHGWFSYQIWYNGPWRWAWSGLILCGKSGTTTTATTAATKTANTTTFIDAMTANTTTTTMVSTAPARVATTAPTTSPTTVSTTSSATPRTVNGKLHSENTSFNDRATFNPRALYPSVAGVVVVLLVVCLAVILIRRRRIKKTASGGSPTTESTSPGPALPSVRYDHRYSDVDLNLPASNPTYSLPQEHTSADEVSRKHPIVPSVPADELYAQVNETTKPEEPHTADNLTYWSAEELAPYVQQEQDEPIGNEDSSIVLPNDDLYAVVRKFAHREEKMAPIPKLDMTENDIYGT